VAIWILAVFATLWFLRTAMTLLIPIALAVLISYALEPVVTWLERHRIHRMVASGGVLLVVLAGIVAGGYALRDDARQLVEALPQAAERAREFVTSQLGSGADALNKAGEALGDASSPDAQRAEEPTGTSGQTTGSLLQQAVSAIFAFAGHAVVIVFLVLFLLMSGHHMKNRIVEVMGRDAEKRRMTATIIDDINNIDRLRPVSRLMAP
jgi:predicted PurR-regulated permease PerM